MNKPLEVEAADFSVSAVKPAYQQVADQLCDLILKGNLAAGDRLPAEPELAEHFSVSRSTVRESLRALSSRDLVHTRRGATGGTFVSDVDAEQVSRYLETSLGLMSGRETLSVQHMLEAREVLEVPAARLAAQRRTPAQLAQLRQALARERSSAVREDRFAEHRTFHQIVVDASANPMLSLMTEPVFRVLQAQFLRPGVGEDAYADIERDHRAIFEAIAAADAATASSLMADHLTGLREIYHQ